MKNKVRLIKNILVIFILCGVGYFVYSKWSAHEGPEFNMSETPLQIDSIEKIAQLATVSFKDEVVADTIERYASEAEKVTGNLKKLTGFEGMKEALKGSSVKRRLTLIMKGEAKIGFDLTEDNYKIDQNIDTIWFHFPKAKILSVNINPSETEVFQESGIWKMYARKKLMSKAKRRIEKDVKKAKLKTKAEDGMTELLKKIIPGDRTILVYYE